MKTFKNALNSFLIPAVLFGIVSLNSSCSKDDSSDPYVCATCKTTPDALAANDGIAKGVYKGIVVGSSGTISINVQNGADTVTATMVLDGTTILLTSTVTPTAGQSYLSPFTGTYNGSPVSFEFSIGSDGGSPTIVSSDIPGHPDAVFTVMKETSASVIEAFEGTYSQTGETGTFNIILSDALHGWGGIAKEDGTTQAAQIDGGYANGQISNDDGNLIGTITGDELHGSFPNGDGDTVTITGHRTL